MLKKYSQKYKPILIKTKVRCSTLPTWDHQNYPSKIAEDVLTGALIFSCRCVLLLMTMPAWLFYTVSSFML